MDSNPIRDILPEPVRRVVYAALFLAALAYSIWQTTEGDWDQFAGSLVIALVGLLAANNVGPDPQEPPA